MKIRSILIMLLLILMFQNFLSGSQPEWTVKPIQDKSHFYAVGYIEDIGNLSDIREKAFAKAKAKIAAGIIENTEVQRIFETSGSLNDDGELRKSYTESIISSSSARLTGVEIEDTYYEKTDDSGLEVIHYWVLAKISRNAMKKEQYRIEQEIKRKLAWVDEQISKAEKFEQNGEITEAVNAYLEAAANATAVEDRQDEFPMMIRRANQLLNQIIIEPVTFNPLIDASSGGLIQFRIMNTENGKKPAEGVRIQFSLYNNRGNYTSSDISGKDGIVTCRINRLNKSGIETRLYAEPEIALPSPQNISSDFQKQFDSVHQQAGSRSAYVTFYPENSQALQISAAAVAVFSSGNQSIRLTDLESEFERLILEKGMSVIAFPDSADTGKTINRQTSELNLLSRENIDRIYLIEITEEKKPEYNSTLGRFMGIYSIHFSIIETDSKRLIKSRRSRISATSSSKEGVQNSMQQSAMKKLPTLMR